MWNFRLGFKSVNNNVIWSPDRKRSCALLATKNHTVNCAKQTPNCEVTHTVEEKMNTSFWEKANFCLTVGRWFCYLTPCGIISIIGCFSVAAITTRFLLEYLPPILRRVIDYNVNIAVVCYFLFMILIALPSCIACLAVIAIVETVCITDG